MLCNRSTLSKRSCSAAFTFDSYSLECGLTPKLSCGRFADGKDEAYSRLGPDGRLPLFQISGARPLQRLRWAAWSRWPAPDLRVDVRTPPTRRPTARKGE